MRYCHRRLLSSSHMSSTPTSPVVRPSFSFPSPTFLTVTLLDFISPLPILTAQGRPARPPTRAPPRRGGRRRARHGRFSQRQHQAPHLAKSPVEQSQVKPRGGRLRLLHHPQGLCLLYAGTDVSALLPPSLPPSLHGSPFRANALASPSADCNLSSEGWRCASRIRTRRFLLSSLPPVSSPLPALVFSPDFSLPYCMHGGGSALIESSLIVILVFLLFSFLPSLPSYLPPS